MTDPRDDEALSWGGDDDPTLDTGVPRRKAERSGRRDAADVTASASLPDGFTAVGRGSEALANDAEGDEPVERPALGNAALVGLGILGGIYLLFTVGWFIGGSRLQEVAPLLLVSPAAYVPAFWLAVLAPAIWFGVTLLLTRSSAAWSRFVWLTAGAVLLVPWPFIMIGAVGQ